MLPSFFDRLTIEGTNKWRRRAGLCGSFNNLIPASLGSRLLFLLLHFMHDVTTFSQEVPPPLSLGKT